MLLFPPNAADWNRFGRTLVRVRELHHWARDRLQARCHAKLFSLEARVIINILRYILRQ